MNDILWVIVYILSWVLHISWVFPIMYFLHRKFKYWNEWAKFVIFPVMTISLWLVVTVLCYGCLFTPLHDLIAMKANWIETPNSQIEKSIVFKRILYPVFSNMDS